MPSPSPFSWLKLDDQINGQIKRLFLHHQNGLIRSSPGNYVLTPEFEEACGDIYNLELREDDVWIVTYPKAGTTWAQEIIWQITHDLDFKSSAIPMDDRFFFLESPSFYGEESRNILIDVANGDKKKIEADVPTQKELLSQMDKCKTRRFIKSHLPLALLPRKLLNTCKVIYVARNPRDVAVSLYYHSKSFFFPKFVGSFEEFWELFKSDNYMYSPFWSHVKEAWNLRNNPNMFFTFYEDMKKDITQVIGDMATFLEKPLHHDQIEQIADHVQIDRFRNNSALNYEYLRNSGVVTETAPKGFFIRKGIVGDWRNHFSEEMNNEATKWIANMEEVSGVKFLC